MLSRPLPVLLLLALAAAPPACSDDQPPEPTGRSAGSQPAAGSEPGAEEREAPGGGGGGGAPSAGDVSFDDLPELSRERQVLWESDAPGASRKLVWRPDPQTAIALSVQTRESGGSITASVQASLGGRMPATVYRCTELGAEAGSSVAIQLDAEGAPHILCESRGESEGAGSTFGVRLAWNGERRAVVPSGTWKAPRPGVSPDEALRAARDAGTAEGAD